ncbi:FliA/WhiG family RNA polymerase sigma factor [Erwinia sorbitola]|uniref:FliA/WhiG family RNA polymerase sigma factor n=1 Tax=Erwinia sorbitola TaxID=2681984 RepID=A0A6I6EKA8_9GAMM|nr:FliA/WhiG family RNA polymerase sigma factor [Erwinia sorbitola]MTD26941.1 FliA/WhiG family RNA polymerase sigma factor [Erwinia sorbitola]QGU88505.1 FliA/WhiG family RNA polymerase sigma factor [Erwinia sorbitola]
MSIFTDITALSPVEESRFMMQWLPLVKKVVRQLSPQANGMMDCDDIEQIALMGLLESLRRYGKPDEQFAGYAMQRVRGAVLDQFRLHDWRPRTLRQKTHKINDALREMARSLGREPTDEEARQQLGLSSEEWQEYLLLDSAGAMESLDEILSVEGRDHRGAFVGRELEEEVDTQRTLALALNSLNERERIIINLYYQQGISLKEIALVLDITEARVCQLNKKISEKIKAFF